METADFVNDMGKAFSLKEDIKMREKELKALRKELKEVKIKINANYGLDINNCKVVLENGSNAHIIYVDTDGDVLIELEDGRIVNCRFEDFIPKMHSEAEKTNDRNKKIPEERIWMKYEKNKDEYLILTKFGVLKHYLNGDVIAEVNHCGPYDFEDYKDAFLK